MLGWRRLWRCFVMRDQCETRVPVSKSEISKPDFLWPDSAKFFGKKIEYKSHYLQRDQIHRYIWFSILATYSNETLPNSMFLAKVGSIFCHLLNKPEKFSPNLVTLLRTYNVTHRLLHTTMWRTDCYILQRDALISVCILQKQKMHLT